jgi:asparagine synthetase B (glutamine-hydrolysing)
VSDFIVSIGKKWTGDDLLNLLKRPYGERAPEGQCFDFGWGSIAILEDRLALNKNIIRARGTLFAWVGDLVTDMSDGYMNALISRIESIRDSGKRETCSLESDEIFKKLNGAFALLIADHKTCSVVTDPLGFTHVYFGKDGNGEATAIGTHADLVAAATGGTVQIDVVSAGEFLKKGYLTFPNTMYENVKQLYPGHAHCIRLGENDTPVLRRYLYWFPPDEATGRYDTEELCENLRRIMLSAVRERCDGNKVGVLLSGGLDSRLVIAASPKEVDCVGLTSCDRFNRETKIARKVTQKYNRGWIPMFREKEYLGNNLVQGVKLIGCECEFNNALALGFADAIREKNVDAVLTGLLFDTLLRGYCAADFVRVNLFYGLLPAYYKRVTFNFASEVEGWFGDIVKDDVVRSVNARISAYHDEQMTNIYRISMKEWMKIYPFSHWIESAIWASHRRTLPMRLVGADRRLLDFAFRCPFDLKLGNRIFFGAAKEIYGPGLRIPSANDGVRPCSGHWWRLVQRAIRKFQDRTTRILEKLGKEPKIQHSYHDYQKYWRESEKLDELRYEYGSNLDQFDGVLFKESGRVLLERKDLHWQDGFRLLQLAVWKGLIKDYKPGK